MKEKEKIFKGFILYIYDINHFETRLIGLPSLGSFVVLKEYNERFDTAEPAFYLDGKPVWLCIRGIPFSLEFEEIDKQKVKNMMVKIPSSSEIESKAKSLYTRMIFGKKMVDNSYYLISLLLCVITGLVVHLIDRISFSITTTPTNSTANIANSTNATITAFQLMKMGWFL